MRELTTIGDLRTTRRHARALRLSPVVYMAGIGDARLDAAILMNDALAAHGYNVADQDSYRAFQAAAGLKSDGFPGSGTMSALFATLDAAGIGRANVPVYAWTTAGGWGGSNAPSEAAWNQPLSAVSSPGYVAAVSGGGGTLNVPTVVIHGGTTPSDGDNRTALIVVGLVAAAAVAYGVARYMSKKKRGRGRRRAAPSRALVLYP